MGMDQSAGTEAGIRVVAPDVHIESVTTAVTSDAIYQQPTTTGSNNSDRLCPPQLASAVDYYSSPRGSDVNSDTASGRADPAVLISVSVPKVCSETNARSEEVACAPAAKKRRLSTTSKEVKEQDRLIKQQEKEAREFQRAEEKRRREEERRRKEEKKKAKEEERLKKERAQTKLNSFFTKPKLPEQPPNRSTGLHNDGASAAMAQSDYNRQFPEFFVQSNTRLAPMHRFSRDPETLQYLREKMDIWLKSANDSASDVSAFCPSELFQVIPYKRRQGRQVISVRSIMQRIQTRGDHLDTDRVSADIELREVLRKIPMKSLKFHEDVRPAYQGTYSKLLSGTSTNKLSRNPFHRGLPETNYDYDSEAEWEDPGEGEDLDTDEEEEMSEEGDDDMSGFLDDEGDCPAGAKRRLIAGDLEPICTGIRWQENGIDAELQMYRAATISDAVTFPIDPFSTIYWNTASESRQLKPDVDNAISTNLITSTQTGPDRRRSRKKRLFPSEQLAEFKQVVHGSDLSKTGVVEVLKRKFPEVSKEALRGTLDLVAQRVGQKEADKRWVCQ